MLVDCQILLWLSTQRKTTTVRPICTVDRAVEKTASFSECLFSSSVRVLRFLCLFPDKNLRPA